MGRRYYCPECDIPLHREVRPFFLHGIPLGDFDALVCSSCGRVGRPPRASLAIEREAKRRGMWGNPPRKGRRPKFPAGRRG